MECLYHCYRCIMYGRERNQGKSGLVRAGDGSEEVYIGWLVSDAVEVKHLRMKQTQTIHFVFFYIVKFPDVLHLILTHRWHFQHQREHQYV